MSSDPGVVAYDDDLAAWSEQQEALLRAGRLGAVDLEHVAEEIESVGASERREVRRRLARLLQHLLKWRLQPAGRGRSWLGTIRTQRMELAVTLDESPSLRRRLPEALGTAYALAREGAQDETGHEDLPPTCPFTLAQVLDPDYLPD
jgi:hypothetical protein